MCRRGCIRLGDGLQPFSQQSRHGGQTAFNVAYETIRLRARPGYCATVLTGHGEPSRSSQSDVVLND